MSVFQATRGNIDVAINVAVRQANVDAAVNAA
jgi:hypothetical protein